MEATEVDSEDEHDGMCLDDGELVTLPAEWSKEVGEIVDGHNLLENLYTLPALKNEDVSLVKQVESSIQDKNIKRDTKIQWGPVCWWRRDRVGIQEMVEP
jgi:hypothetical protein